MDRQNATERRSKQFERQLPLVTKIDWRLISTDDASKCRSLKYFEFQVEKGAEFDILKNMLGSEYSITFEQRIVFNNSIGVIENIMISCYSI